MKFTPGPWDVKFRQNVVTKSGRGIATCGGYTTNDPVEWEKVSKENYANAHLIAAAPEMYDVLIWLLHLCHGVSKGGSDVPVTNDEWGQAWRTAMDVISKAEGREDE